MAAPWVKYAPAFERRDLAGGRLTSHADSADVAAGRGTVRPALPPLLATPGAGETERRAAGGRSPRTRDRGTPGAARDAGPLSPQHRPKSTKFSADQLAALSILGPAPFRPGQVLAALRAGRSVRDVETALLTILPRREARIFIAAARAILARRKTKGASHED